MPDYHSRESRHVETLTWFNENVEVDQKFSPVYSASLSRAYTIQHGCSHLSYCYNDLKSKELAKNAVSGGATTAKQKAIVLKNKARNATNAISRAAKDRVLSLPGISKNQTS